MSIWATLSAIDCSAHVEKKGQFSYLAWTWAIAMVKERYPEMTFKIRKPKTFPDETVMVRTKVTIDGLTHECWLPVTNHQNKPISDPNAFDRNTATMRCLVKNFAFFGLGHYIYAGESLPQEPTSSPMDAVRALTPTVAAIKESIASGDYSPGIEAWRELSQDEMQSLWVAPSKGGVFTTEERKIMQSTEFKNGEKAL